MNQIFKQAIKYLPNGLEVTGGIVSVLSSTLDGFNIGHIYNLGFGGYFIKGGLTPPELPILDNLPFYKAVSKGLNEAILAKGIVIFSSLAMGIYFLYNHIPPSGSFAFATGTTLSLTGSLVRKHRLKALEESLGE